jgi:hypothetical protein
VLQDASRYRGILTYVNTSEIRWAAWTAAIQIRDRMPGEVPVDRPIINVSTFVVTFRAPADMYMDAALANPRILDSTGADR